MTRAREGMRGLSLSLFSISRLLRNCVQSAVSGGTSGLTNHPFVALLRALSIAARSSAQTAAIIIQLKKKGNSLEYYSPSARVWMDFFYIICRFVIRVNCDLIVSKSGTRATGDRTRFAPLGILSGIPVIPRDRARRVAQGRREERGKEKERAESFNNVISSEDLEFLWRIGNKLMQLSLRGRDSRRGGREARKREKVLRFFSLAIRGGSGFCLRTSWPDIYIYYCLLSLYI